MHASDLMKRIGLSRVELVGFAIGVERLSGPYLCGESMTELNPYGRNVGLTVDCRAIGLFSCGPVGSISRSVSVANQSAGAKSHAVILGFRFRVR